MDEFDTRAATWDDDPRKVARARMGAAAIRSAVLLTPRLRVLEYGAGTGLLGQELIGDVGPLTLADPSAGMREVMHAKIAAGLLPGARVIDLDLSLPESATTTFDLIVTMMALHHIPDLQGILTGFAASLGAGGTLCIIDLDAEDGSFHGPDFLGHPGFDREELSTAMVEAGFGPGHFEDLSDWEKQGRTYHLFLATCQLTADNG